MHQPPGSLQGTLFGTRSFNLDGKAFAYDLKNNLFTEISYNPDKKGMLSFSKKTTTDDYFRGGIYRMNDKLAKKINEKYAKSNLSGFSGINVKEDVQEELSKI